MERASASPFTAEADIHAPAWADAVRRRSRNEMRAGETQALVQEKLPPARLRIQVVEQIVYESLIPDDCRAGYSCCGPLCDKRNRRDSVLQREQHLVNSCIRFACMNRDHPRSVG